MGMAYVHYVGAWDVFIDMAQIKKKRIVHTMMGVLHSFFEKRLYYEQIHLYMWIKIKLSVVL